MTREEGNKLIDNYRFKGGRNFPSDQLQYDTSWDAIMPIVEQIKEDKRMGTIGNTIAYLFALSPLLKFDSIQDLWTATTNFIKRNTASLTTNKE